ncbi:MAG: glycine--tRNA ligase [Candidatus Omnitrophica bacterium]|nr:glycine--tRNA ligase [Candidatus Omnitrophota bacterium]MDD5352482.1 glycine--tRNA ligase [Candidatus Omnitrophota bacterium]MDD5550080.1 glycine--tRNA ligase [Candidatus Omnitrophota bacterium]
MANDLMDKIVSLCKRRGLIFQSSEIYGGLGSVWDYGPLGVELKRNVKEAWWKSVVYSRDDMVGLDAAILMHPKTWEASGHLTSFADLMVDCKKCKKRFKAEDLSDKKKCKECGGELTEARPFNLMFETYHGPVKETAAVVYLRPETAQGIFVNFSNILDSSRKKLPFGVAQIGKSFRNEITPGNFTFRTREFEQMEIEYFVNPNDADKYYKSWVEERFDWYLNLGIKKENLRKREHKKDELAHYAKSCSDIEYNFPFGWSELEGIANRSDFDLKQHSQFSGKELKYFDDKTNEKYFPYIIEPSGGVDRATLAFLVDSYNEEEVKGETRVSLKLHKDLAPTKIAVFPLLKNRPQLVETAKNIASSLKKKFVCVYDDTAAIGKLYRRQDEVGTLFCITVDVQSLEDKKVTVRDRDTMQQERIDIEKLEEYFHNKL